MLAVYLREEHSWFYGSLLDIIMKLRELEIR